MPANLTPQYHRAEEQYRRATTPQEELQALEIMFREMPKHKGTDRLQADIKQKIAKAKKEAESAKKSGPKAQSVKIPRQGAGNALLIGPPNSGKSQLIASLTKAKPEIADYPFTTRTPTPGMMDWEDVKVQLIDTPPITADYMEPYMQGLIRGADVVVLVIDMSVDEGIEQCQELLDRLNETKTRLGKTTYLDDEDIGLSYTQTLLVMNKMDAAEAEERLTLFREMVETDFEEFKVSATNPQTLEPLRTAIYQALHVIRVYTKNPRQKEPDYDKPFTLPEGSNVLELAGCVHKDFVEKFKFGKLWGVGVHDGEMVKGDHVLHDRDVVELHVG